MTMPALDINKIKQVDSSEKMSMIIDHITNKGKLRATKPARRNDLEKEAAYVWRHVAFVISPKQQHQCMPIGASFDLAPKNWDEVRKLEKELDKLVDVIIDTVDKQKWHGIARWSNIL